FGRCHHAERDEYFRWRPITLAPASLPKVPVVSTLAMESCSRSCTNHETVDEQSPVRERSLGREFHPCELENIILFQQFMLLAQLKTGLDNLAREHILSSPDVVEDPLSTDSLNPFEINHNESAVRLERLMNRF